MKKQNKVALRASASPRETSTNQVATTALTVRLNEIVFPKGVETLGQKANFLHGYSVEASKRANGAAIMAGWVLSVARSTCAHGQWMAWLAQNVSFSQQTATNYMNLYARTLGKARANARRPIALTVEPTVAELEAAAHDVDGSTLAALYKSTRIMATPENWGGSRVEQAAKNGHRVGCKPKGEAASVAEQLDEIANNETLLWAALKGALDALVKLDAEKDVWHRLSDEHLSSAVGILSEVAKKSSEALMGRIGDDNM